MIYMLHSLISSPISSENSSSIGKLSSLWWWICFAKIRIFHLKSQILFLPTNTASCFPWSDRLTSFSFKKMSAKYLGLNSYTLFVILSRKNVVLWRKSSYFKLQLNHKVIFLKTVILQNTAKVLFVYFPLYHTAY